MSDEIFNHMLYNMTYTDEVLIIEPQKRLFWDAYYDYVAKSREILTPAAKQFLFLDN